jgi:hypothetical protein
MAVATISATGMFTQIRGYFGTHSTKVIAVQINDDRGFSVPEKKRTHRDCANARDGLFDCGHGGSFGRGRRGFYNFELLIV